MKAKDIEIGRTYTGKVSGRIVPLKVTSIDERYSFGKSRTVYRCTNLLTGREIVVRSPQRFRAVARDAVVAS